MKKLTLILTFAFAMAYGHAQVIEQLYHYGQPIVTEHDGYQQLGFQGCLPKGQVGEPTIPWQSVSLILPQGQEAATLNVEYLDVVELEGSYNLYPYQQPRPLSYDKEIPFAKNETLYHSDTPYPSVSFSAVSTQYLNGVAFAFGGFTPIQYVPATGKVQVAQTVKVTIGTTASRDDHSRQLWLTPGNVASIKRLAQNDDMLNTYNKRGREIGGYDMLVITGEDWISRFGDYLNLYNGKGIRTQIVSLEEIYATMEGRDQQEQIRNYIIQEYENNGIMTVSLGGDVSIVPYRSLWCIATDEEQDNLPADMYYACLDGTWNDDNDELWGEVGEDDLLPELGIGRLPFNNEGQFETIMHKTFSYLQTPVLGEFTSPILGAEHLGDGYYGSADMERLIGTCTDYDYTTHGYPSNYNFKRYYASPDQNWSGRDFRLLINTGGQYVHHVGHANTQTVAGWENSTLDNNSFAGNNGIDHNYMLFHSHGCICGDFSHACILEKMITLTTGFVATTGNSRYGWYQPWGDGMAAHIHREFVDAYCYDHIDMIGLALKEAKIMTTPYINTPWGEDPCFRWNIYCLNVLGDGALCPWFEEPFSPNVVFEQGLKNGTTSTLVHVSHFDTPLDNFCVSLFDGETLLARAITNADGDAELLFSPALDVDGAMQLIVTGQSAWPQSFEVERINNNEAFVYGDFVGFEGEPVSGTQSLWISGDIYNKGYVTANQVQVSVTTDSDYIVNLSNNFTIDVLEPNDAIHYDQLGSIDIADDIPDQTLFTLQLTTTIGDISRTTQRSFSAKAPNLQFSDFVVDDSMGDGNGYADPGESVIIYVDGINAGHSLANDTYLTVTCDNDLIQFTESTIPVGDIDPEGTFSIPIAMYADANLVSGTLVHLNITLHTGAYTSLYDYLLPVGLIMETFESGDFSYLSWIHDGEQPWIVTDDEAHTGSYSARSGSIGDDEISKLIIRADIVEDGELSFYFKTSTQNRKDYLVLYIDNRVKGYWSGENDWTYFSIELPAGSHVIAWHYDKNKSQSAGSDCVWIDDITMPRSSLVTEIGETVAVSHTSLYPNPCNGSCNICLEEESNVTVFNMLGQKVMALSNVSGTQQIHLEDAPKGMYLIQIQNNAGIEVKKLTIR